MRQLPSNVIAAAKTAHARWKVPASVTLAQYIQESGWGEHMPPGSNNPFGIKAVSGQQYVVVPTREYVAGRYVTKMAPFAKYADISEAFMAHAELLATSRYYTHAMAETSNPEAFANALTGVYATDPHYGTELVTLMREEDLEQYDH